MTIPQTSEEVEDALEKWLDSLGHTAADVYTTLKGLGVTGGKCNSGHCPLANAANKSGLFQKVETSGHSIAAWSKLGGYTAIPLSRAAFEFVRAFDKGQYPDMVDPRVSYYAWTYA